MRTKNVGIFTKMLGLYSGSETDQIVVSEEKLSDLQNTIFQYISAMFSQVSIFHVLNALNYYQEHG